MDQSQKQSPRAATLRSAPRCVPLTFIPFRGGELAEEVPAGWPNGFGQFAAGAGMRLQRTPQPARAVVRLHRTTDPPRAHLWAMFLCEQKEPAPDLIRGGSAGGSPAKRLTSLAAAETRNQIGVREKRLASRAIGGTLDQSGASQQREKLATANNRDKKKKGRSMKDRPFQVARWRELTSCWFSLPAWPWRCPR